MAKCYPPLPELDIHSSTREFVNQENVDFALKEIYERRPDLFRMIFERIEIARKSQSNEERDWLHDETSKEFQKVLSDVASKHILIEGISKRISIFLEAERRALIMYGSESR